MERPSQLHRGSKANRGLGRRAVDRRQTLGNGARYAGSPAPELRRAFTLSKRIANARLDVTGLGYYVLRLDGKPLDDRVLAPGWTSYNKRVLYDSFDVTDRLAAGRHAFGAVLGRGFYANAYPNVWFLVSGDYSTHNPKLLLR